MKNNLSSHGHKFFEYLSMRWSNPPPDYEEVVKTAVIMCCKNWDAPFNLVCNAAGDLMERLEVRILEFSLGSFKYEVTPPSGFPITAENLEKIFKSTYNSDVAVMAMMDAYVMQVIKNEDVASHYQEAIYELFDDILTGFKIVRHRRGFS